MGYVLCLVVLVSYGSGLGLPIQQWAHPRIKTTQLFHVLLGKQVIASGSCILWMDLCEPLIRHIHKAGALLVVLCRTFSAVIGSAACCNSSVVCWYSHFPQWFSFDKLEVQKAFGTFLLEGPPNVRFRLLIGGRVVSKWLASLNN